MGNHNVTVHHLASAMATSMPYIVCSKFLIASAIIGSVLISDSGTLNNQQS